MNKLFFLLLFSCWVINTNAQKLTYDQYELMRVSALSGTSQKSFDDQFSDIKGSPYFQGEWLNGEIWKSNGNKYLNLKLKIDLYRNRVFMNSNDTIYDMTDIPDVTYFIVHPDLNDTSNKIIFSKRISLPGLNNKLVQVLTTGKTSFLKLETYTVTEIATGITGNKESEFTGNTSYYVLKDNEISEVKKLNKKSFEKLFTADEDKISAYVKDKDLSFSEEKDWAALINFYNTL
jgi:hypothetical protein